MTTSDKYWWIIGHVAFLNPDCVNVTIDIEPHNVCPLTNRSEDYEPLNTKTQLWIEFIIPYMDEETKEWGTLHDWQRDVSGYSYEEAIDNLYNKVLEHYGDYTDEDYNAKFNSIHNITSSFNPVRALAPHELHIVWSSDAVKKGSPDEECLIEEVQKDKDYLYALTEFKKTCTIEQLYEVNMKIQNAEHDIWVKEESLRIGIDIDL